MNAGRIGQVTGIAAATVMVAVVLSLMMTADGANVHSRRSDAVLRSLLCFSAAAVLAAIFRKPLAMFVLAAALFVPTGWYFLGSPAYPMGFGVATILYALSAVTLAIGAKKG